MARPWDDLRLTLHPLGPDGRRPLSLSATSGGPIAAADVSSLDLADLCAPLQRFPEQDIPEAALTRLGEALARLALPTTVREALQETLARDPVAPVRLRLHLPPDLADLPWEFLYAGSGSEPLSGFLALHPRLHLMRDDGSLSTGPQPTPSSLASARMLLVHADSGAPGYPRLPQRDAEVQAVCQALRSAECRRADVTVLADATPASLRRALDQQTPQVLHLICHGDQRPSGGVLVLQGERDGTAAFVYADELADWAAGVGLTVLSACRSGAGDRGLAQALSRAGVPAVVAMQLRLRDAAAGPFARALYAALLDGLPVDAALSEARRAVRGFGGDWGVPQLTVRGDPAPLFAPEPAAAAPFLVPYRPSEAFVGREEALAALHHWLVAGQSAALVGLSGLGKTQTAVEYTVRHREAFPGGVFWVTARETRRLADDLAQLGREQFGAPTLASARDAAVWARDALTRRPGAALLVCDDLGAETDLSLLPPTGTCRLLITAREGFRVPPGIRTLFLPPLTGDEARTLLGTAEASASENAAAAAIAHLLGGLPLALALVAHHIARLGLSLSEYRERLEAAPFDALQQAARRFRTTTGHEGALYETLALSWDTLDPVAARVLEAAACLGRAPIPLDLLQSVWNGGPSALLEEAVGDLVFSGLLQRGDGTLSLHSLVRAFVWARAGTEGADEATGRLVQAASALTSRLAADLDADRLGPARAAAPHAEAVAALCRSRGLARPLAALLRPLGSLACREGRYALARDLLGEGLTCLNDRDNPDPDTAALRAALHDERAEALFRLDERRAALSAARAALRLARRVWGRRTVALAPYELHVGLYARHLAQFGRARRFYEQALAQTRAAYGESHPLIAECLNNLGTLLEFQGKLEEALPYLTAAAQVYGDALGPQSVLRGVALNNLGRLQTKRGDAAAARRCHQEALTIHEAAFGRRHPYIATGLFHAAEAAEQLGLSDQARNDYTEALSLYEHFYGSTNSRSLAARARLTP